MAALGPVGGWKVGMSGPRAAPGIAPVLARRIIEPGLDLDATLFHGLALEVEFGFRLNRNLPKRTTPWSRDEVADAISFVPVIEIQGSRFLDRTGFSEAENLADGNANGALVVGAPIPDWAHLNFPGLRVTLTLDDVLVQDATGTHPAGDPVYLVQWTANHVAARTGGLRPGDIITTGSLRGATAAGSGAHAVGDWGPGGQVVIAFLP
jgi:2-keto-4-pentenoate hydratase